MAVTGSVSITAINSAIETTLAAATGLTFSQDYDELTEGMNDTPTLQVYWFSTLTDPDSNTSQRTFRGVVRQTALTFYADLYARQRSHIAEDMGALLPLISAIQAELESQRVEPYFGLAGIKAIEGWSAQQAVFELTEGVKFTGARFIIRVRVF